MRVFGVIALCVRGFNFAKISQNGRWPGRSAVSGWFLAQKIVFRIHRWSLLKLLCKDNYRIHVPAGRNQEYINELFADFRFLIFGREVEIFLRVKILCQGLHCGKCFIEVGRHGGEFAREIYQRQFCVQWQFISTPHPGLLLVRRGEGEIIVHLMRSSSHLQLRREHQPHQITAGRLPR